MRRESNVASEIILTYRRHYIVILSTVPLFFFPVFMKITVCLKHKITNGFVNLYCKKNVGERMSVILLTKLEPIRNAQACCNLRLTAL